MNKDICKHCARFNGLDCVSGGRYCSGSEFIQKEDYDIRNLYPEQRIIFGRGNGKTELQKRIINSFYGVSSDGVGTGGFTLPKPIVIPTKPIKRKHYDPGFNTIGLENHFGIDNMMHMQVHICIEKVIFSDPATIVYWSDDTKTVVKCGEGDTFDPEKGLAMAISKKVLGNGHSYYDTFKKHIKAYDIEQTKELKHGGVSAEQMSETLRKVAATARKLENKGKDNE